MEKDGRPKRRKFSAEYKAETVRLIQPSGKSIGQMALELGIGETALRRWVDQAEVEAGRGPEGAMRRSEREELVEAAAREPAAAHGARDSKKSDGLLRQGERVRFAFVATEKACYPVALRCRMLKVSRSGYYAWRQRPAAKHPVEDQRLTLALAAIHAESHARYGSLRVHAELRERGRRSGRKRVARLMRAAHLRARARRRFRCTTDSTHAMAVRNNLLARRFAVPAPNSGWVTDITYLWTLEGWLYLAVMLDLFSPRVIGWALSERLERTIAVEALQMALSERRPASGLLHHSDRGSQYASQA